MLAAAALFALAARPAHADLPSAANWARLHACRAAPRPAPLREDERLRRAAEMIARGATLHQAMAAAGYVASSSSVLHFSGAVADAEISRALVRTGCGAVTAPQFHAVGTARRAGQAWIVLAAAAALPPPRAGARLSRRVLDLVNQARAAGHRCAGRWFAGVPPLVADRALAAAALEHSNDMARHEVFDHRGHDGSTPAMRVRLAGYGAYRIVGENIAAGAMTPAAAVRGWLASPGHCENIMDGRFADTGIALAVNPHSPYGSYWTEDFASRALATR